MKNSIIDDNIISNDNSFSESEKNGLYKAIFSRRDVRSNFIKKNIPYNTLARILNAAHHAPSVGFSQPWNFILIKSLKIRELVKESFIIERKKSISMVQNTEKKRKYTKLKLEGILESSLNICVTYDPTRFGPFVLGRTSIPETGVYSVCCAIQNLWLAARSEGIGVGWVSIISNKELKKILDIPEHVTPVAYLCLGYVTKFPEKPDLEKKGWLKRMSLGDVINYEKWNNSNTGIKDKEEIEYMWNDLCKIIEDKECIPLDQ